MLIMIMGSMPVFAFAMSVTYDFNGGPTIANSLSFTSGGVTLDVTASTQAGNSIFVSQNLNGGLGACLTLTDCGRSLADSPQIDSVGPNEELHFALSGGSLQLDSFLFGAYNLTNSTIDNFRFYVDGVELTGGGVTKAATNPWNLTNAFGGPVVANSSFSIRAISGGGFSSFRISALYANNAPTAATATALAEPATIGLLGIGFLSMLLIRRRAYIR
jgi:hypothetical protein